MSSDVARWFVTVGVLALLAPAVGRADIVLSVANAGSTDIAVIDFTAGWTFTTNQAITLTALDAFLGGAASTQVRLYDTSNNLLASGTVTSADPTVAGGAITYNELAIAPVSLAANTTYFIVEDVAASAATFSLSTTSYSVDG